MWPKKIQDFSGYLEASTFCRTNPISRFGLERSGGTARPAETFAHHERLEIPRRPLGMVRRRRDDRPPAGRSNGVAAGEQALRRQPGRNGERRACPLAFRLF